MEGTNLAVLSRETPLSAHSLPQSAKRMIEEMKGVPTCELPPLTVAEGRMLRDAFDASDRRLQPATPLEIGRVVAGASTGFPTRKMDDGEGDAMLALYRDGLSDVPRTLLNEAFRRCVRTCKFFPTVAELREAVAPEMGEWRRDEYELKRLLSRGQE